MSYPRMYPGSQEAQTKFSERGFVNVLRELFDELSEQQLRKLAADKNPSSYDSVRLKRWIEALRYAIDVLTRGLDRRDAFRAEQRAKRRQFFKGRN